MTSTRGPHENDTNGKSAPRAPGASDGAADAGVEAEVGVSWARGFAFAASGALLGAGIFSFNVGGGAEWLGRDVSKFSVAAVAVLAFASSLCAREGHADRAARWIAIALGALSVLFLEVCSLLVSSRGFASGFSHATAWSAPLAIAAWVRATRIIIANTPRTSPRRGISGAVSGVLAAIVASPQRWPGALASTRLDVPPLEAVVWVVAACATVTGFVPGLAFNVGPEVKHPWRGWQLDAGVVYQITAGPTILALVGAACVLTASFALRDTGAITPHALARIRHAPVAAWGLVGCGALIYAATLASSGAEPPIDLFIAASGFLYALAVVDAATWVSSDSAYSSPLRRGLGGMIWIALVLLLAAGYGEDDFQRALVAGALAAVLPFGGALATAVQGSKRGPPTSGESTADEGALVYTYLTQPLAAEFKAPPLALSATARAVEVLTARDLWHLIRAYRPLPGEKRYDVRRSGRLKAFLLTFPPLLIPGGTLQSSLHSLVTLVYKTALAIDRPPLEQKHPTPLQIVRVFCVTHYRNRLLPESDDRFESEEKLLRAWQIWAHSTSPVAARPRWDDLYAQTLAELRRSEQARFKRGNLPALVPQNSTAQGVYERDLLLGLEQVREHWRMRLRPHE